MVIASANRLQEVQEYYFSTKLVQLAEMRERGEDIINLGIGNPDLTPSSQTINSVVNALNSEKPIHGYQAYRGTPELVDSMKNWYQSTYQTDNKHLEFVPLMGSKEGIMHISMAFLNKEDGVLIPNPGYPAYSSVAKLLEAKSFEYSLSNETEWYPDFKELEEKVTQNKIKILWVNYPHMPTGTKARFSVFNELIQFAKQHQILIVHDNPYSLILNENPLSIFNVKGAEEVAIELNSLSKSHNMAGWRVGMLVGRKDYIDTIMRVKTNFDSGMFKAVQIGAINALKNDRFWHQLQNNIYKKRQAIVFKMLNALNCQYSKNISGMFVWAKIPDHITSGAQFSNLILEKTQVFITPGFIFGSQGDKYIRISLCINEQRLTEALLRIKNSFKK